MSEVKQEGDFKMKSKPKMKKFNKKAGEVTKVDLSEAKVEPSEPTKVVIPSEKPEEVIEVVNKPAEPEAVETKEPVIQEVTEEQVKEEVKEVTNEIKEAQRDSQITGKPLPENIEKLVSFMEDTGGNIEDYVRLNADYTNVDEKSLLKEYYKRTKPHLNAEEINFLMEDNFSFDEDLDDERDIKLKKLAIKEEVAQARNFLEQTKSKYYDEIKLRPGVTQEQKKAMDFFNRYNQDQEVARRQHEDFKSKTNNLFTNDFKGFDFKVGDKKFRYGVQDPSKVAEDQANINNFVGKFLDDKGNVTDAEGYHKALYMASNSDTIINHFYEQGKADATKDIINKSKNPSSEARQVAQTGGFINGIKAKVVGNDFNASKLKIKKIKI